MTNFLLKNFLKICCIAFLALPACQQDNSPAAKNGAGGDSLGLVDEESMKQQGMKDPQTSDAFDPAVLQSYLPETLKEYRGNPASTGTGFKEGYSWTQVSRSYNIPTGDLRIMITDFADIEDFVAPKVTQIKNPFPGPGESARNINISKDILAYESWNDAKHSGRLEAIVANRFYIEILATNLPAEFSSLEQVLKTINLDRLKIFPAKK